MKKAARTFVRAAAFLINSRDQYMPPMSGPPAGAAGAGGSFLSATSDSVVRIIDATEAAFSRAERATLVGSTMPSLTMSQ